MSGYTCRNTYFNYGSYLRSRGYDKEICNLVTAIENGSINLGSVQPNGTEDGATINGTLFVKKTATSDNDPVTKQGQIFVEGGQSGNPVGDAVLPSELGSQLYNGAHVLGPIHQTANISHVKQSVAVTQGYKRSNVFSSHEHIFQAPLDISDTIVRIKGDLIVDGSFVMVADEEAESLTLSAGSTHNREMLDIFHGARQAPGLDIMDVWLDSSQNVAIAEGAAPPPAYESLLAFAIDGDLSGTIIGDNGSTGVHGRTRMLRGATITSVPEATGLDISYAVLPAVINPLALDLYGGVRMQAGPTDPSGDVSEPHLSMRGADARFSIGPSLLQTKAYITADGSGVFQDMSAATAEIGDMNITTLSVNTLDASNVDASGISVSGAATLTNPVVSIENTSGTGRALHVTGDASFNGAIYASDVVTAPSGFSGNLTGNVTGNLDGIVGGITPAAVTGTTITATTLDASGISLSGAASLSNPVVSIEKTSGTGKALQVIGDASFNGGIYASDVVTAPSGFSGNLTGDVTGDITSTGESTFTNKVNLESSNGTPARIDFYCEVSNAHYTSVQSANHANYSGNVTATLPTIDGTLIVGDTSSAISQAINTTGSITANAFNGDVSGNLTGNVDGIVGGTTPAAVTGTTITANTGFSGDLTGDVDGIVGGTTPAAVTGTTITANTGFSGDLTGDVIGDLSANITNFIDLSGNNISCNHIVTQTLSTLNGGLLATEDVTIIGGDLLIGGYPGPTTRFSVAHASGDVSLNGTLSVNDYISGSGDLYISGDISGSGDVYFNGLTTPTLQNGGALYIKSNGQVYESTSSRRFKTNIESINNDTATNLSSLNPVTFNYTGSDVLSYGLIAEEVAETSFSSIVTKDVNGDAKGIDYSQLIAPLIALVKQQNEKIQSLEERIAALEPSE